MAMLLRTVSTCGGAAAVRVRCGIESTGAKLAKSGGSFFQDQEQSFSKGKNSVGFSQSVDPPARCQAAVATVAPLPTRQSVGLLERPPVAEPEARPATIDQRAEPLPRSFLAESVNGALVECSARGSRPLYTNVLAEFQRSYTGTAQAEITPNAVDIVKVTGAFHAALADSPADARLVSEFAMFTWKALGDVDTAEELYNKALAMAPQDPNIQANHALFLWQCDE
jgi:hypothetical protein